MSKAILVMDMPKTCYECRLSNRLNPDELILCDGKIVSDTSTIFNFRPGWCPLREIPKRLNSNNLIATAKENNLFNGASDEVEWFEGKAIGWNACIDEIIMDKRNQINL